MINKLENIFVWKISTYADVSNLTNDFGYTLEVGIGRFVEWYKAFCGKGKND